MITVTRFHEHLIMLGHALPVSALGPTAASHGLEAALGYAFVQGLLPPSHFSDSFVAAYKTRLAIDLGLRAPLDQLAVAFAKAGIRALLLKGEAWSRGVYPVAGVRGRCDCDIWVSRRDRGRAIAVLEGLGIREVRPYACAGEVLTPEALFRGMGLSVDLHWQLSTLTPISRGLHFEHCWQTSLPVPGLSGWRMLGPTEALLHAALHLACPGPTGPRWIWALDGLLLLDWAAADSQILERRAEQAQIVDLWQTYLDYVRVLTQPRMITEGGNSAYQVGQELRMLLTRAPWRDRLQVIRELLWPREAFLRDRYPDSQAPLFWLQMRRWSASAKKITRRA
jgi:hypothetical protein